LNGLRHHAVVGRHHQHHDVGGAGTAGPHGGERLVARGVDEGDRPVLAVVRHGDLVGADVLGDAAGLTLGDLGVPDGVQQLGLAVVDVTHDGHHRRPRDQRLLATLVLAEGDVEGLQQLAVLVLPADHLDLVAQLGAQQLQRLVVDRLGRGDHLAEVEHHLYQRRRVGVDLFGEVGQRGTPGQPDHRAVAARDLHATDRRRLHVVEPLAGLLLALAGPCRTARAGPATAAAEPAAATAATRATAEPATGTATRATAAAAETTATAATATATATGTEAGAGTAATTTGAAATAATTAATAPTTGTAAA